MPVIVDLVPAGVVRIVAMVAVTAVLIWFGMWLGQMIGRRLRLQISHPTMRTIDKFLGAIGNTAIAAVLISLIAFSVSSVGAPGITSVLKQSRIVPVVTQLNPESARAWIAPVRADVLDSSELPELELADDDGPDAEEPAVEPTTAVEDVSASSVRITGRAYECGQSQTGSGSALAPDRAITNAHAVAGAAARQVESNAGPVFSGEVVAIDPEFHAAVS